MTASTAHVSGNPVVLNYFASQSPPFAPAGTIGMSEWVCNSRIWDYGCFHYATPTSQRPTRLTRENGTAFSDQTGSTNRNDSTFSIPFPNPHMSEIYWSEVGQLINFNVKMKQQISIQPVRLITVWRWSQIFQLDHTETDLSVWLLTKISKIFVVKSKHHIFSTCTRICTMHQLHVQVYMCSRHSMPKIYISARAIATKNSGNTYILVHEWLIIAFRKPVM